MYNIVLCMFSMIIVLCTFSMIIQIEPKTTVPCHFSYPRTFRPSVLLFISFLYVRHKAAAGALE